MSFTLGLSGLNAAQKSITATGHNISNAQTVGYKGSQTLFSDVFAREGLGTHATLRQDFSQGTLSTTDRALDFAVNGEGFFQFQQGDNRVYSRNGQLVMTPEGYLENAQGARLLGKAGAVQVPFANMAPRATATLEFGLNLDAAATALAGTFDPADQDTYTFSNSATVYDSQGGAHTLTTYYVKSADNSWDVYMGGAAGLALDGGGAPAKQTLTFDANGLVDTYTPGTFTFPSTGGAAPLTFTLDVSAATQFANASEVTAITQDGYAAGSMLGIEVAPDGRVMANFSNEQRLLVEQLDLAFFRSPEGLQPVGDNAWMETLASGQPVAGTPGSGRFGSIMSGTVEESNIDMAGELVKMIVAQRNYQASSNTIKTADEILQVAVNLK